MEPFSYKASELPAVIEAVLFAAAAPVTIPALAEALEMEPEAVTAVVERMVEQPGENRGVQVVRLAEGYQLRTRLEYAGAVERFLQPEAQRLSRQALETLAIVAYRQPVTLPEVDALRGVSSGGVIRTLLDRELVEEAGRKDAPGRPYLYRTTMRFLEHFGLSRLSDLPPMPPLPGETAPQGELQI